MTTEKVQYEIEVITAGQELVDQLKASLLGLQETGQATQSAMSDASGGITREVESLQQTLLGLQTGSVDFASTFSDSMLEAWISAEDATSSIRTNLLGLQDSSADVATTVSENLAGITGPVVDAEGAEGLATIADSVIDLREALVDGPDEIEQLKANLLGLQDSSADVATTVNDSSSSVVESIAGLADAGRDNTVAMEEQDLVGELLGIRLEKMSNPLREITSLFSKLNPTTLLTSLGLAGVTAGFTALAAEGDEFLLTGVSLTSLIAQYSAENVTLREIQADLASQSDALGISQSELEAAYLSILPVVRDYGLAESLVADAVELHRATGLPLEEVVRKLTSAFNDGTYVVNEHGSSLYLGVDAVEALKTEMLEAGDEAVAFKTKIDDAFGKLGEDVMRALGAGAVGIGTQMKEWIVKVFAPETWWTIIENSLPDVPDSLFHPLQEAARAALELDEEIIAPSAEAAAESYVYAMIDFFNETGRPQLANAIHDMISRGVTEEDIKIEIATELVEPDPLPAEQAQEWLGGVQDYLHDLYFPGEREAWNEHWDEVFNSDRLSEDASALYTDVGRSMQEGAYVSRAEFEQWWNSENEALFDSDVVSEYAEALYEDVGTPLQAGATTSMQEFQEWWWQQQSDELFNSDIINESAQALYGDVGTNLETGAEPSYEDFRQWWVAQQEVIFDVGEAERLAQAQVAGVGAALEEGAEPGLEEYEGWWRDYELKIMDPETAERLAKAQGEVTGYSLIEGSTTSMASFATWYRGQQEEIFDAETAKQWAAASVEQVPDVIGQTLDINKDNMIQGWELVVSTQLFDGSAAADFARAAMATAPDAIKETLDSNKEGMVTDWATIVSEELFSQLMTETAARSSMGTAGAAMEEELTSTAESTVEQGWWSLVEEKLFDQVRTEVAAVKAFANVGTKVWDTVYDFMFGSSVIPDYWELVEEKWMNPELHETQMDEAVSGVGAAMWASLGPQLEDVKNDFSGSWGAVEMLIAEPVLAGVSAAQTALANLTLSISGIEVRLAELGINFAGSGGINPYAASEGNASALSNFAANAGIVSSENRVWDADSGQWRDSESGDAISRFGMVLSYDQHGRYVGFGGTHDVHGRQGGETGERTGIDTLYNLYSTGQFPTLPGLTDPTGGVSGAPGNAMTPAEWEEYIASLTPEQLAELAHASDETTGGGGGVTNTAPKNTSTDIWTLGKGGAFNVANTYARFAMGLSMDEAKAVRGQFAEALLNHFGPDYEWRQDDDERAYEAFGNAAMLRQLWDDSVPSQALATGGVVTSPTFSLIGEAGPEAVIPLSRLESILRGGERFGGGETIEIHIDGKRFERFVLDGLDRRVRLRGAR